MNSSPKRPAAASDLSALSALAPQLAQTFVSVASDIALVIDADGVIRSVAVGSEPSHAAADGWVGRRWADTVTDDTRGKIEQLLSEVRSGGVTRRREVNHPLDGGGDVPIAYAAVRLGDQGPVLAVGRDLRLVAAIQQRFIDAQQEMERDYWKQRREDSRYRMLFQVATDAVMVVDAESLRIVEANRAAAVLLSVDGEDIVGEVATVGLEAASRAGVEELLLMARTTGRPAEVRARLARQAADVPLLAHQGLAIDVSATPFRSADAMLLLVRARAVAAGEAPSLQDERLAEFVAHTPDLVVITDSSSRVLVANPAFVSMCRSHGESRLLGRTLAEAVGDPQRHLAAIVADTRLQGIAARRRAQVGSAQWGLIDVEVSAALLAEGDQECVGLTMRRVGPQPLHESPTADELASAIDNLALQIGVAPLATLVAQSSALAERHWIETALRRTDGDMALAADLLHLSAESLAQSMQRHGLAASTPRPDRGGNGHAPPSAVN